MDRKIRMGMVGGGPGAFIGAVHRMAATLDGRVELVCGAFSADPEKSRAMGRELFLVPGRAYPSWQEMFRAEAALAPGERMDFAAVVTPNHVHFPVAAAALEHGFHVMCDKPLAVSLSEARELAALAGRSGLLFCLTHNYTGYPMVKQARALVAAGAIGAVRKVVVEYPQGWLSTHLEASGDKQASWRTDPARSGASGCMGDIGTHAANLAEYVTGLEIAELCADLTTFVPGRLLDDDGNVLVRFSGEARGVLYASQVSAGEENPLRIRVYGEKGGLEWAQMEPNTLLLKWLDRPTEVLRAGGNHAYLSDAARAACRLPAGHPEGFIEAFANLYRNFALALDAVLDGREPEARHRDYPGLKEGLRGMAFIETVVQSAANGSVWTKLEA